jgi:ABC-2 type transport system permease protein
MTVPPGRTTPGTARTAGPAAPERAIAPAGTAAPQGIERSSGWTAGRDALRAEWTKQRTVAGPAWLLAATVVLTTGIGAAVAAAAHCRPGASCEVDTARLSLTGVQLGQAVVAVLAATAVGAEYGTGLIRVTLAAVPGRLTALAAKAVLVTVPVMLAATGGVLGALLAGRLLLPGHGFTRSRGFTALTLTDGPVLRAAGGSVLYLALVALLTLGIAMAVRDTAAALGVVLGLLYLFPIIGAALTNPSWHRHLDQVSPMTAGLAIQATSNLRALPIAPWPGLGVLGAWAAAALLVGALSLRFRDA